MSSVSYFSTERHGAVYLIPYKRTRGEEIVICVLRSGEELAVLIRSGYFPRVVEMPEYTKKLRCFEVNLVYEPDKQGYQTFANNWDFLIPLIEAAAGSDNSLSIQFSEGEYEKLKKGGFAALKKRLSKHAGRMVRLQNDTLHYEGVPSIEVLRLGRCP